MMAQEDHIDRETIEEMIKLVKNNAGKYPFNDDVGKVVIAILERYKVTYCN